MYSHSVFLNYCVAYVYIDGLDSLNRTREIIYLSRCVCYRSICLNITPVVKRLLVLLLSQLHHSFISLDVALVAGVVFFCCCYCPCLPNRTGPLQMLRRFPCCGHCYSLCCPPNVDQISAIACDIYVIKVSLWSELHSYMSEYWKCIPFKCHFKLNRIL